MQIEAASPPIYGHALPLVNRHAATLACAALALVAILLDAAATRVNVPILFVVVLVLYALAGRRRALGRLALALSLLTLAGYTIQFFPQVLSHPSLVFSFRLVNRTFDVTSLAATCILLQRFFPDQTDAKPRYAPDLNDPDAAIYGQVRASAERFLVLALAVLLAIALFVIDLSSPGQINFAILYAVPLLVVGLTGKRRNLLILTILVVILAVGGYVFGKAPINLDQRAIHIVELNRALAVLSIAAVSGCLQYWLWRRAAATLGRISDSDSFVTGMPSAVRR